jgi:hypothetical protein
VGIDRTFVIVGHAAPPSDWHSPDVRPVLNPFFEQYGILGSVWLARPHLDGVPFVFTTGDHYFELPCLQLPSPIRPRRIPSMSR